MKTSRLILLSSLVGLSACTQADTKAVEIASQAHYGVEISDARVRPPLPGRDIAAGYFTLESVKEDRLLAVSSPISTRIELHTHLKENGVMTMRKLKDGVSIPAGEAVEFKPGGLHLMFFDVVLPEDAADIALTFDFENSDDVTVIARINDEPVYGSDTKPDYKKAYDRNSDNHGDDHHHHH